MPKDRYDDDEDDRDDDDRPRRRSREDDDDEYDDPRYSRRRQPEGTGMAVASLVLGILSVVLFCVWYLGVPMAILAIIFGTLNKSKDGKSMATAGIVLGIVSLALFLVVVVIIGATWERRFGGF
jgi:hypothetical protein